jgi:two-component system copper resistance phosphate regulon response regulator CusR
MERAAQFRILVIEDDPRMVELLRTGLWERGHTIVTATTAAEGEQLAHEEEFDAIVLDIGLPDRSGYTIAQSLYDHPRRPAIIMLTALNQEDNVVYGLDAGADDYLCKPFSFPELVARIASATRSNRFATQDELTFGPFRLDVSRHMFFANDAEIHLTRSEYMLLHALALRRGEVVRRRQLMQAVWGANPVSHGALDTLVNTLREKLADHQPGLISTVRGVGYSLLEDAGEGYEAPVPRRRSA